MKDLPELLTLRDVLRYAVSRFNAASLSFGHGSDNAWDEAVYLALHHLHLPLDTLEPFLDARLLSSERQGLLDLIAKRVQQRLPAAYLTGEAWLRGYRFEVTADVIVPRSPIAELLDEERVPGLSLSDSPGRILDMCTGSGCLAIIAAHLWPEAEVDAVDVSEQALAVARRNVATHGLEDRLELIHSNLFEQLGPERQYGLIICNPPYVNSQSMDALPPEYRHEPELALAGGNDGMDLVRRILEAAPRHLTDDGLLLLEIGHERPYFEAAFPELNPLWLATHGAEDHILLLRRTDLA